MDECSKLPHYHSVYCKAHVLLFAAAFGSPSPAASFLRASAAVAKKPLGFSPQSYVATLIGCGNQRGKTTTANKDRSLTP